eukprot:6199494-Pleurochrysis_carterae.AAC.3
MANAVALGHEHARQMRSVRAGAGRGMLQWRAPEREAALEAVVLSEENVRVKAVADHANPICERRKRAAKHRLVTGRLRPS